jgi:hypothetical protein
MDRMRSAGRGCWDSLTVGVVGCRTVGCGGCRYGILRRVCIFLSCSSIIAQLISRSLNDMISNTV